ncbi:helix-turn-helix domain-containing protein [Streptomyces sp. SYSU K21746]
MERAAETQAFADCLRGLKERAGLSYGTLAGRLHVSTSTLHRYCNGDAVPVEFATVDRFGRQCGASRQEMAELHRRWLLADAHRTREPGRGLRNAAGPAPGPASDPVPEPGGRVAGFPGAQPVRGPGADPVRSAEPQPAPEGGRSEGEPGAGLERRPEPQAELALGAGAEPVGEEPQPGAGYRAGAGVRRAVAGAGAGARPEPQGEAGYDAGSGGRRAVAGTGAGAGPRPEPQAGAGYLAGVGGRSRRRAAVAAGVGALVAAVIAVDLATGSTTEPARGTGRETTRVTPVPSAPRTTAGSTPTVEPTAAGPRSTPGRRSPRPKPPATVAPAPPAHPPLTWTVRSHVWQHGCDHSYLIDRAPKDVPAPPVEQDASTWAAAQRAVHGRQTVVEITVQGDTAQPAVLQALQVRVTGRRTPLPWNLYAMSQGCGGILTPATFAVNLDAPRPLARPVAGFDGEKELPAVTFPFRVSSTDPVVLRVEADTSGCDCDWYLELVWTRSGRSGTTRIDDGGRPFRTSAAKGRPEYGYAHESGRWATGQ